MLKSLQKIWVPIDSILSKANLLPRCHSHCFNASSQALYVYMFVCINWSLCGRQHSDCACVLCFITSKSESFYNDLFVSPRLSLSLYWTRQCAHCAFNKWQVFCEAHEHWNEHTQTHRLTQTSLAVVADSNLLYIIKNCTLKTYKHSVDAHKPCFLCQM